MDIALKKIRPSHLLLVLALALVAASSQAAAFMPILHNFGKKVYGGALQNWDVTQGKNGEIYVGNSAGVLRFDGYTWKLTPLPGGGVVRSVMADGDRLYVGSYREFGYFTADKFGNYKYTSLYPENLPDQDEEIWNIMKDKNGHIYFQSFFTWFRYDGKKVEHHYDMNIHPLYFFEVEGNIYAQLLNDDFYQVQGRKFRRLISRQQVGGSHIVSAVSAGRGRMILSTQWQGLYKYENGILTSLPTEADAALKCSNVNRATFVPHDSTIVVGTILDGVYGFGLNGKLKWHYNMSNRLGNNSVLDVKCDDAGNVWVALDAGVALINSSSPFSLLSPGHSGKDFGMVYGVYSLADRLYFATNQAVWALSKTTGEFSIIPGTEGQNWFVDNFNNQIIAGNNEGPNLITGLSSARIAHTNQSSTAMQICNIAGQRVMLESSYYSLQVYKEVNGKWAFSHSVANFHAPVAQFEVDHYGNVWASHMSHGMFRINLSNDLKTATFKRYEHLGGEKVLDRFHVFKMRGRVIFSYNKKLYTYDDLNDTIVRFNDLKEIEKSDIYSAAKVDENTYWISTSKDFVRVRWNGKRYVVLNNVAPSLFGLDNNDETNTVYVDGGMAYFCLNNGVGRFNMAQAQARKQQKYSLRVLNALTTDNRGVTRNLPVAGGGDIESNITITLTYPNYSFEPLHFCYHLKGGGITVDNELNEPVITYNSLSYGDYHLTATVKSVDGTELATVEYSFSYPRPWYLAWWAILLYVLMSVAAIYLFVRNRTRKTARDMQRQYEDKKLQQDIKMLEQEKIIAEQKQQLLEAQLNDKTKEVASMALDAMARNQAIEGIKTALREKHRKGSISQSDMQSMLTQLGANADSDNFWELYQNNFNLIHKNFFKNLKEKYPSLTPSDLRFCALLRLNLSTKDIAKFTQLSVRGVEGARYRLRKKFNLDEGTSLIDFLLSFQ